MASNNTQSRSSSRRPSSLWIAFSALLLLFDAQKCKAWVIPTTLHCYEQRQHKESSSLQNSISSIQSHHRIRVIQLQTTAISPVSRNRLSSRLWITSDDDDDSTPIDDNEDTQDDYSENLNDDSSDADVDAVFYREYQKAKLDKLGLDIPPEQLKASAVSAEQEFLQAMKQCQNDFEEAQEENKEDDLSAADFFLDQIKKEEALEELWSKQTEDEEGDEMEESEDESSEEDYFQ